MSLYLFLIFFAISVTIVGAILVLLLQSAEEEHDEEIALDDHVKEQYEAIAVARGLRPEATNSSRHHHHHATI